MPTSVAIAGLQEPDRPLFVMTCHLWMKLATAWSMRWRLSSYQVAIRPQERFSSGLRKPSRHDCEWPSSNARRTSPRGRAADGSMVTFDRPMLPMDMHKVDPVRLSCAFFRGGRIARSVSVERILTGESHGRAVAYHLIIVEEFASNNLKSYNLLRLVSPNFSDT
jgi:hypothetical protein